MLQNRIRHLRKKLADQQQEFAATAKQCASWQNQVNVMTDKHVLVSLSCKCLRAAFTSDGSEKMHKAYLEYLQGSPNSRHSTITSGGVDRMVNFELMQQKHHPQRKSATSVCWPACLRNGQPLRPISCNKKEIQ